MNELISVENRQIEESEKAVTNFTGNTQSAASSDTKSNVITDNDVALFYGFATMMAIHISGYDFSDKSLNLFLATRGVPVMHKFIMLMQHRKLKKEAENQELAKEPLLKSSCQAVVVTNNNMEAEKASHIDSSSQSNITADSNEESIPLIGNSFYTGTKILLASASGVGKTLFSIYLALIAFTSNAIKRACFFALEDKDKKQNPRYREGLNGYDYAVVSSENLTEQTELFISNIRNDARWQAFWLSKWFEIFPSSKGLKQLEDSILRKKGVNDVEPPPKLLAFLDILGKKISQGFDFIVIDSLSEIFENTNHISRHMVNTFLELATKSGITFIVIHHVNGKNEPRGSKDLLSSFESAYIMEKINDEKDGTITNLSISIIKNRYDIEFPLTIRRTRKSPYVAEHELVINAEIKICPAPKKNTFKNKILEYILNAGANGCTFDNLYSSMEAINPKTSPRSVKNNLSDLDDDGLINLDRSSWYSKSVTSESI